MTMGTLNHTIDAQGNCPPEYEPWAIVGLKLDEVLRRLDGIEAYLGINSAKFITTTLPQTPSARPTKPAP